MGDQQSQSTDTLPSSLQDSLRLPAKPSLQPISPPSQGDLRALVGSHKPPDKQIKHAAEGQGDRGRCEDDNVIRHTEVGRGEV